MSWKPEKIVSVTAYHKDESGLDYLGWCWKPVQKLNDGQWQPTEEREQLFGRVNDREQMTPMSYTLNTHRHETWNEWLDQVPHDRFYFDAGSNGYPIYVEMDEMKRAMIELGLYKLTDH